MRKYFTRFCIIYLFITTGIACISHRDSFQSIKPKKFYVKPVCLSVIGIHGDESILKIFENAFTRKNVKLISQEEMQVQIQAESKRVFEKIKTSKKEFTGSDQFIKAVGDEQNYVVNMITITLELEKRNDSLMIYKAGWINMPMPPNFNRMKINKSKEIDLVNLSYSFRENIYSIVDSILYSKELY